MATQITISACMVLGGTAVVPSGHASRALAVTHEILFTGAMLAPITTVAML